MTLILWYLILVTIYCVLTELGLAASKNLVSVANNLSVYVHLTFDLTLTGELTFLRNCIQ